MIPKTVRDGAVAQNLVGETRQFTISANGKAFRTLIDGLYSNKVMAVIRELCSNAQDSHIAAGQSRPFQVFIPSNLDPTFRVRDFGTSLDHEDVMGLYTTIFQSSKETTNEQTGMLGLGSKSPFAFVDSFSVIAYKDGQRRVYLAFLAQDGVPSLTHVSTSPSSDPQGLEVSFAVPRESMYEFQNSMQFVAMGYKTLPEVIGMKIIVPKPRMEGRDWAIYSRQEFRAIGDRTAYVRQGSALYPSEIAIPNVANTYIAVLDIPIGTAEVAASREALSYDSDTRMKVKAVADRAYSEIRKDVDDQMAAAKTRIEKALVAVNYVGVLTNVRGFNSNEVSIQADYDAVQRMHPRVPGDTLERADFFGKGDRVRNSYSRYKSAFDVNFIKDMTVIVNESEVPVVRRFKRVQEAATGRTYVLNVLIPTERLKAIAWLKQCLELKDSQFVKVQDLPDCPPPKKAYQKSAKRSLAPNQFWMVRDNGCVTSELYGRGDHIRARYGASFWPKAMTQAANVAGIALDTNDTFWVTTKQAERWIKDGTLDPARKLDIVVKAAVEKMVDYKSLDKAQTFRIVTKQVNPYSKALPVVIREFFPDLSTMTDKIAQTAIDQAFLAQINLDARPVVKMVNDRVRELTDAYPLLFQRSDERHFQHYVNAVKAAEKS